MNDFILILKALCRGNGDIFNEVTQELIEAITVEEIKGIKQVDTEATLRLAIELEKVSFQEEVSSRTQALKALKAKAENPALIEHLLGQKGRNFKATA